MYSYEKDGLVGSLIFMPRLETKTEKINSSKPLVSSSQTPPPPFFLTNWLFLLLNGHLQHFFDTKPQASSCAQNSPQETKWEKSHTCKNGYLTSSRWLLEIDKGETELRRGELNEVLPNFPKGILTCGTNSAVFGMKATFK